MQARVYNDHKAHDIPKVTDSAGRKSAKNSSRLQKAMEPCEDSWGLGIRPSNRLNVIVVGAGIAGLTSGLALSQIGHDVIILEQCETITEVGAGIQMAPNNMRILGRLGVLPDILGHCNFLQELSLRRWQNNEELGKTSLMPEVAQEYGAPIAVIHRGDLQTILLRAAKRAGVDVRTGATIACVDEAFEARVQLSSGEWINGDVVIAADGVRSIIRKQLTRRNGDTAQPEHTGDAAYRLLIPRASLEHDPYALSLLESDSGMRWMGPQGHIMGYPIKNNTVYNMVMVHPETGFQEPGRAESWTRRGNKYEMLGAYKDWCPEVRRLLSYAANENPNEWTLCSHPPLMTWTENRVALIGDACHPMLPYVAQGCAQGMEDAAVLQCVLALSSQDVKTALQVYQLVRKERAERIQASAMTTRRVLHLPDGPEQQKRDMAMRLAQTGGANPDLWADTEFQRFMWGTDVMHDTVSKWSMWKEMAKELNSS